MILRARFHLLLPIMAIAIIFLLYASTLQTDINGRSIPPLIDVGELEVALSSWGTTHPTGYPLYTIIGNLMAELGRFVHIAPVAATSAFSMFAVMGIFILVYMLVWQATRRMAAALAAMVLLALSPILWLNGVVTEVYMFSLLLIMIVLYAAWRAQQGKNVSPVVFSALLGLMFAHHRTTFGLVPPLLVLLWQPARTWLASMRQQEGAKRLQSITTLLLVFLAPFTLYAYMPLRIIQKAPWIYEQQRFGLAQPISFSLSGFIKYQLAREYYAFVEIPQTGLEVIGRIGELRDMWTLELGPLCLAAGLAGLLLALFGKQRRLAMALWLMLFWYSFFGMLYHVKDIPSLVTPSFIPLVIGSGLLIAWVAECMEQRASRPQAVAELAGWAIAAILVIGPLSHLPARHAELRSITKDPAGRGVITATKRIPETCPTVLSLWGIDYFAYHYAKLSTRELPCLRIEPLHADIRQNWQRGERVFVSSHFFYQTPLDQLQERLGRVYLRSAGFGNVEISNRPASAPDQEISGPPADMGGIVTLLGYHLQRSPDGRMLYLSLYWRADRQPPQDYSVFVHVSDKSAIAGPADIVSQADSLHPVYGWYPTTRWSAGEVIRDDYAIAENATRPAQLIAVGLYRTDAGTFTNLGRREIRVGTP